MATMGVCHRLGRQLLRRLLCLGACIIGALPAGGVGQTLTTPFVVPLQKITVEGQRRLGISASFAGATLSPPPEYVFDTGSSPLVSAYQDGAPWWGEFTTIDSDPSGNPIPYTSGSKLYFTLVATSVTLTGTGSTTLTTGSSFQVAQAYLKVVNGGTDTSWLANSPPAGSSPPDQNTFYGTFGADLQTAGNGLLGFVNQLTMAGDLRSGFIVDATGAQATLTIGLDAATRGLFGQQFQLNTVAGGGYDQNPVNAAFQVLRSGGTFAVGSGIPTLFDTGTPGPALIKTGSGLSIDPSLIVTSGSNKYLAHGAELSFLLGGVEWRTTSGVNNEIAIEDGNGVGAVVLGRPFFDSYKVMYDVQDGTIGFLAATPVPEPATVVMAFSGLACGGYLVWRRRCHARPEGPASESQPVRAWQTVEQVCPSLM